ncbi:GNAT family N-acetyltransferase [Rubrobacter indicoceani]|uniref:GNAT family N-acetyltransferase n=1 Tax=Rubrobacter indicoceani TaxID=2051957 RepID=UPI000E5AFF64|nr:GNAT family N-acetyltransferase [Rubrobacter indicoceani]
MNGPRPEIRSATEKDVPLVLDFIKRLAHYEKLSHEVVATEESLRETLFGERRYAEVLIGHRGDAPVAFALFFHNYSTFLGKPGIYLEDLFVLPEHRGSGYGREMLLYLAGIAVGRGCGRLEWSVLDWNEPAIGFYKALGAVPMDGWTTMRVTGDALSRLAGSGS